MADAPVSGNLLVIPSVLDRLLENGSGSPATYSVNQLKKDLLRDLQNLLNTRMPALVWSDSLGELNDSLLTYGRPDLDSIALDDTRQLQQKLELLILRCETRISALRVQVARPPTSTDRTIELRIDATLSAHPDTTVTFGSQLNLATGVVEVTGRPAR